MRIRGTAAVMFGIGVLTVASVQPAQSQDSAGEVEGTIVQLFDAMRAQDGRTAATLMHSTARLQSVVTSPSGETQIVDGDMQAFVEAIGTPRDDLWDEKIWDMVVQVDGDLATAWMNYAFFLNDQLSHCGVNAFQLVKLDGSWKITQVIDTRRMQDCAVP